MSLDHCPTVDPHPQTLTLVFDFCPYADHCLQYLTLVFRISSLWAQDSRHRLSCYIKWLNFLQFAYEFERMLFPLFILFEMLSCWDRRGREISYPLVHSQSCYNGWNWADPKPAVRSSFWVSLVGAGAQVLGPFFTSSRLSPGSWVGNGAARVQTGPYIWFVGTAHGSLTF